MTISSSYNRLDKLRYRSCGINQTLYFLMKPHFLRSESAVILTKKIGPYFSINGSDRFSDLFAYLKTKDIKVFHHTFKSNGLSWNNMPCFPIWENRSFRSKYIELLETMGILSSHAELKDGGRMKKNR
jgi:hypothetical protein